MHETFVVFGEPVAKGRPRFTKSGIAYTPEKTVAYENLVKLSYQEQCGNQIFSKEAMLRIHISAFFSIPKSTSKKKQHEMKETILRPIKKPDADNLLKSIADALNKIAYYDDSQIVSAIVEKYYSENPRAEIVIEEINSWKDIQK